VVRAVAPTFGGINLEDIKAPECFAIEEELKASLDIPVFHDDQHGTAIITGAALLNALELTGRSIADVKVVVLGAGAAGIACATLYQRMGVRRENIRLVDRTGVVYSGRRENMNRYKERFAADTGERTLAEALRGADVFLGLSGKDLLSPEMLLSMADRPVVFALANPDPEIRYDVARKARPDALVGTGRSDCPNQINNVLGFPFIFRGALDVRARAITDGMKVAAARALALLAHEDVPQCVFDAYGVSSLSFGPEYLIPTPFDPRVLFWEAPAVARAAMEEGVARVRLDLAGYPAALEKRRRHCHRRCRFVDSCLPS
jgi:malate dehydrogenase (oxaloacetate-decarboxylating)(NADP+)